MATGSVEREKASNRDENEGFGAVNGSEVEIATSKDAFKKEDAPNHPLVRALSIELCVRSPYVIVLFLNPDPTLVIWHQLFSTCAQYIRCIKKG